MYTEELIVAKETVPAAIVFKFQLFHLAVVLAKAGPVSYFYFASFTKITYTGKWSL